MTNKIRNSAKGEECTVRIPGVCNFDPETTVLAHLNGAGMGMKNPDYQGAYCCSACHDMLDGRSPFLPVDDIQEFIAVNGSITNYLKLLHLEGVIRTQEILREKGLIEVKG